MKIKFYYFVVFAFFAFNATSQTLRPIKQDIQNPTKPISSEFCGTDFLHKEKMKNDPKYRTNFLEGVKNVKKISSKTYKKATGGILQIPVVVHVPHLGEGIGIGTNMSDDAVKSGIKYLNDTFRKTMGTHRSSGNGPDMKIEFVLAIQDPNGNCTNGINRVDMSGVPAFVTGGVGSKGIPDYDPNNGVNSLKEYCKTWDPTKYLNIWAVYKLDDGLGGYAYLGAGAQDQPYDGVVLVSWTYTDEYSHVLAHEVGHYLNLPHTFGFANGTATQCEEDNISDTPLHKWTTGGCEDTTINQCDPIFNQIINPETGFRRNTGTRQDHLFNYMDYSGCPNEFTGGQRAVMLQTLSTYRASLLTSPGLIPVAPATVFFSTPATNVCLGQSLQFRDESSCTPNTYLNAPLNNITFLWTFNNNVNPPFTSTLQNPLITFANPGLYDVTLTVTNAKGTASLKKQGNISVSSAPVTVCSISSANNNNNYGIGVTNVSFNTINNATSTFIPANATNDFTCTKNTTVFAGTSYPLTVNYSTASNGGAFLEVWIDWNNNGVFENPNSSGLNEKVLTNNIPAGATGAPSINIIPPANSVLNRLLRMRVVTEFTYAPAVCGGGYVKRADDYGVLVKAACTQPTASITSNSGTIVLTCAAPSISLTASGGVSYLWSNNKGITPTIAITEPGTYTVTVTSVDGCTDTESIVITENKPKPTAVITNSGSTTVLTCAATSISLTASGGESYVWNNGLGNNATVSITAPGTYTVTVTAANGCTDSKSIVITSDNAPNCTINSGNYNNDFGCGVTNVAFNTINKSTSTYIPAGAKQNFVCTNQTTLTAGIAYNLNVTYKSRNDGAQFLDVWIDWDNNGAFETANSKGVNERVLIDNIAANSSRTATVSITPPASATVNTLLLMRVVSEYTFGPAVCGDGYVKRADDYGIIVLPCTPIVNITNNSNTTILTCTTPTISLTASGGSSYSWDNGLGNNATASITAAGTYTVTVTANGCSATKSIVITSNNTPNCSIASFNNNNDYGCGVTNVAFNTINKATSTFIPTNAYQNFFCSDQTTLFPNAYNLNVTYQSRPDGAQFLDVWIDWDNNGAFEISNSKGVNERVLADNIAANSSKTATVSITPPASAIVDTLLRMRVVSEYTFGPAVCGDGYVKRADDYGIIVDSCINQTAAITSNSNTTVLTCAAPSISLTASGGASYSWDKGLGTNASATITSPGTYTVTVTGENGCTATKSIVITTDAELACTISSYNYNNDYGCGVTNVAFNTINKATSTFIPTNAYKNFVCSDQTTLSSGSTYNLEVTYRSRNDYAQYLDVWIDWNNNGVFETSNSNGVNEKVLSNNIALGVTATASVSITPPASATLNKLLLMRVVSDADSAPSVCGSGFVKRADDYGIIVANPTTIWNGSAWSAGVPTATVNALIDGTYNTNVGGVQVPFTANKLTVNTGKSFTINSGTNITVQNEVINNGSLVLENNANLIQINNVTNTGIITVNRNGSALKRLDYALWSSPVTGTQTLAGFSPLTSQTPIIRFYTYNSALGTNGLYTSIAATATFAKGASYLIRMPNTNPLSGYNEIAATLVYPGVFTGVPNNGQVPVTLNYTDAAHAYNLVGNPYPSVIDATTFINANSSTIEGSLYFWRKTNAALGSAYATYTLGGGTSVAPSIPIPNGKIQLGQGFLVQAKNAGLVPNFFTNAMRDATPTSTQFFKTKQTVIKDRVWLNLTNPTGVFSQILLAYLPEATTGADKYDGKYINDSPIALTSGINNEEYTIQSRPTFSTNDEVSLYFKTNLASNYTIAIDNAEGKLAQNQAIYLLDTTTGIETNLKTSSYNFSSESGIYNNRFTLKYQKTLDLVTPTFDENTVTVFKKNKNLHVSSPEIAIVSVQVFDIQGKLIAERKNVNSNTLTIENIKIQDQVMIVKVIGENGKTVSKKIID